MTDPIAMTAISVLGGGLVMFIARAIYDRKRVNGNGVVPKAKNGFLTLNEIESHCEREQENCQKVILADIKAQFSEVNSSIKLMGSEITGRLDQGDRQFDELKKTIEGLKP